MMRSKSLVAAATLVIAAVQPLESQTVPAAPVAAYADLVDLALAAPVVAHVRVDRADALSEREASAVPASHRRFLVEATVVALIRSEGALPGRISYLVDLPNDARGRPARIRRRTEFLILGARVPGRPAELRLAAPDAQLAFSPGTAERLRRILRETTGTQAPPRITGIRRTADLAERAAPTG
jgi:hypothetical protein